MEPLSGGWSEWAIGLLAVAGYFGVLVLGVAVAMWLKERLDAAP